jgi:hypothetical protein
MPRSRNDPHKRKCAQALNHLANAVLDLNEVYEAFDEQVQRMIDADVESGTPVNADNIERYKAYRQQLRETLMYMVVPREQILDFIQKAWDLDEESIKVYMG